MNADSCDQTMSSREEGPSGQKGKGVDPRNWGDANLEESEINVEAQREALSTWAKTHQWAKGAQPRELVEDSDKENDPNVGDPIAEAIQATKERMTKLFEKQIKQLRQKLEKREVPLTKKVKIKSSKRDRTKETGKEAKSTNPIREMLEKTGNKPSKWGERSTPPAMDAATQIAPKSYLGRAFTSIQPKKKNVKNRKGRNVEDSPSESSTDAPSSSSSSSKSSSSSGSSVSTAKKRKKHSKRHKSHKKKKSPRKKSTLKPIPPTEYDGAEDSRAFHRFITEGTAYLEDGNVSRKRRMFTLSRFLKEKPMSFTCGKYQTVLALGGWTSSSPSCSTTVSLWITAPSNERSCIGATRETGECETTCQN